MNESRYFTADDWTAAGIAFLFTMFLYYITLAPTVTLEYSGALVVAADHLGVARPPGYPIWTLLAKGFICLFPFAEYNGHPNPAWAVNMMSAVFGALACGLLSLLACRLSREIMPDSLRLNNWLCIVTGIMAALLFAFSPAMWSQSVIAETHTLTNFYFLGLLVISLRWMSVHDKASPYLLAFLTGLGLTISPLLVLFFPVLLLAAALVSWRHFALMTSTILIFCTFLFAEYRWGPVRQGFSDGLLAASILAITVASALFLGIFRPSRPIGILLVLMLVGLIPYIYLPIASDHNPPINMGYARTWEGFWHVISRGQYESIVPSNIFAEPMIFVRQLFWYLRLAASQFTTPLAALALVPAFGFKWLPRNAHPSILLLLGAFLCFGIIELIGVNPQLDIQNTLVARVYFIPSFALLALLAGLGLTHFLNIGIYRWRK